MDKTHLVHSLLEAVPEFSKARIQTDDDLPYIVFGDFALFLANGIVANTLSESVTARAFGFLSKLAHSQDSELKNLLEVGVLEILTDFPLCLEKARLYLDKDVLEHFENMISNQPLKE